MPHLGLPFLAAVAVALGAVSQAITGFGFSLVSAPFLIAAYRAPGGVQLNLVLSVAVNVALLTRERRHADVRSAALLMVPAGVATFAVGAVVRSSQASHGLHAPHRDPLTIAAGALCLAGAVAVASGIRSHRAAGAVGTAVAGAVSGGMNVAAGIGGPPVVLFALNARWPPERSRPTMQVFFLGINVLAMVSLGLPPELPVGIVVGLAVGVLAGIALVGRIDAGRARTATLAVAAVGGMLAIMRGVLG